MFGSSNETGALGLNSAKDEVVDIRGSMGEFYQYMKGGLDSLMTDTIMNVSKELVNTVPKGTPPHEVIAEMTRQAIEADAARGVKWPDISNEEYMKAGIDWHVFPNLVFLHMATNCLVYRARPYGDNPDMCIFEVSHIERMPESEARSVENLRNDDLHDYAFWGEILLQDFQQMEATQQGIKSSGYKGPNTNPLQETPITNFNRVYSDYLNRA